MGEFKNELIKLMLDRKADENNTIDLNAYGIGLDEMYDKIAGEKASKWISVKDRLPEEFDDVLMCQENGNIITGQIMHGKWYMTLGVLPIPDANKVAHWMPLPEPPKD